MAGSYLIMNYSPQIGSTRSQELANRTSELDLLKSSNGHHDVKKPAQLLIGLLFIMSLSFGTFSQYAKTMDHRVNVPANILVGESQAPNQYRVLFPLAYWCVKKFTGNNTTADKVVIFVSIFFCYVVCGILFVSDTRSGTTTMICLLALYGALVSGFEWKYRQEFFETAFVTAAAILAEKQRPNWLLFCGITLFASLNRETWIFAIVATYVVRRSYAPESHTWSHLERHDIVGILASLAVYVTCFVTTRMYFGLSEYHCEFWMYKANLLVPVMPFYQPTTFGCSVWGIGSGLIWIYLASLMAGNRSHFRFISGYCVPLLIVSFFIADWTEHRIFYSMYPVMLSASAKICGRGLQQFL